MDPADLNVLSKLYMLFDFQIPDCIGRVKTPVLKLVI